MEKIMYISLILIIIFSGCNNKSGTSEEKFIIEQEDMKDKYENYVTYTEKNITIALVMKTLTNPFYIEMENGARKAANELGINLLVKTGAQETSIEHQISIVEELIRSEVNAIVIAPGHSKDLIPVLKKAQDRGIIIVNIDSGLDKEVSNQMGLKNVPFISVNNEEGAYESAKFIADKISKPTKGVILEGIRGVKNAEDRKKGALKAFKENHNINLVASETANWKIDEAYEVISEIYNQYEDIGAIFCANDMMALGVIEYIKQENKTNVLIAGFDALNEARQEIINGNLQVTVNQWASVQGHKGVKTAMLLINERSVPKETYVPFEIVTIDNVTTN